MKRGGEGFIPIPADSEKFSPVFVSIVVIRFCARVIVPDDRIGGIRRGGGVSVVGATATVMVIEM